MIKKFFVLELFSSRTYTSRYTTSTDFVFCELDSSAEFSNIVFINPTFGTIQYNLNDF